MKLISFVTVSASLFLIGASSVAGDFGWIYDLGELKGAAAKQKKLTLAFISSSTTGG
ncbi:MAG: hypothetical protein HY606_14575 [Planctomycetes bacterium]|nr:hypothetical protein [Planctomycetota bacterium]